MNKFKVIINKSAKEARRYLEVAHLMPSLQWLLPFAPLIGALLLASGGAPAVSATFGLVIATFCLWGVAWTFNDLMNALHKDQTNSLILRGVITVKQSVWFIAILALLATIVSFLLGWRFSVTAPLALLVVFSYPWLRGRTYLSDAWVGLGIAWTVPMAYTAAGHWPDKLGALLGVITLLWVTGWSVLRQWPRHEELIERGMRSLGMMFGSSTGYMVIALQVTVLVSGWMAAGQEKHGTMYTLAILLSAMLIAWQSLLLHRKGIAAAAQALQLHTLAGSALWLGIAIQSVLAA